MNRFKLRARRMLAVTALAVPLLLAGRACLSALDLRGPDRQLAWQLVVVHPGDSLWAIADRHGPAGKDVRWVVARMREINRLESPELRVGDQLIVPCDRDQRDRDGGDV